MSPSTSVTHKIELNCPITNQRDLPDLPDLKDNSSIQFLEIWLGPKVVFNSSGIRDWIRWLKPISEQTNLSIQINECPESVIQLTNMISGFMPKNAEIMSFYISFYSEATQESKRVLLKKGHEFLEDNVVIPEVRDKQGNLMELDVDGDKFFRFLKAK
jgi:hypothetical protein